MKKFIISLAVLFMAASLTAQVSVWDGSYEEFDTSNEKGLTEDNPIIIENAAQLAQLSIMYFCDPDSEYKYYKLTTDIDINNLEWQPIGGANLHISCDGFYGYFDGDNHNIYQLTAPLFYNYNGYIKNITVKETTFNCGETDYFGVISIFGGEGKIDNCHNYAGINIETVYISPNSMLYVGGIVGRNDGNIINNCSNHGTINIYSKEDVSIFAGGISGDKAEVSNSSNYGNISVNGNKMNDVAIGGISSNTAGSYCCSNFGDININIEGEYNSMLCGGISADIVQGKKIDGCQNKGNINITTGGNKTVICGGILAQYTEPNTNHVNEINHCYNTGAISADASSYAGGILGMASPNPNDVNNFVKITSCYNVGSIDAYTNGGIVASADADVANVDNCYMADHNQNNGLGESLSDDVMRTDEFVLMLNKYGNYFVKDTEPFVNDGYPVINYSEMNDMININEVVADNDISIYPNPANDLVKVSAVSGQPSVVRVYNTLGMLVEEFEMNSSEIEINVSDYKSGMYFIEIQTEKGRRVEKMIVE